MSGLVFACCSAGRPDKLVSKTLRTLARANYQGVLWLIVPSDELSTYQTAVFANPVTCMIVPAERGLVRQRKHFRNSMLPGTEIVFIDDDVEAIKLLTPTGLYHCTNIVALSNYIFGAMKERSDDCLLAGVYPMANRDWQSRTITEQNSYVVGALYFCVNDERLKEPEHDELEDWYRCLSEQAAGRPVLRFNFVGIATKYFTNPGGMQDERTAEHRQQIVERYAEEFHELVKTRVRRDGRPDLKPLGKPIFSTVQLPQADAPSDSTSPSE